MTKQEAIELMHKGIHVTHEHFGIEEHITMDHGKIVLTEGYHVSPNEFWKWRTEDDWNDGWSIYKDMTPIVEEHLVEPYILTNPYRDIMMDHLPFIVVNPNKPSSKYARLATNEELGQSKVGRNEPCPCGSKLKYKQCCLK